MVKLSELQLKEVIIINSGKRLGQINDLEIDPDRGLITALIVIERDRKNAFFGKTNEVIVYWDQIVTIGSDVILIKDVTGPPLSHDPVQSK